MATKLHAVLHGLQKSFQDFHLQKNVEKQAKNDPQLLLNFEEEKKGHFGTTVILTRLVDLVKFRIWNVLVARLFYSCSPLLICGAGSMAALQWQACAACSHQQRCRYVTRHARTTSAARRPGPGNWREGRKSAAGPVERHGQEGLEPKKDREHNAVIWKLWEQSNNSGKWKLNLMTFQKCTFQWKCEILGSGKSLRCNKFKLPITVLPYEYKIYWQSHRLPS